MHINSEPSVESIKLLTIIKQKRDKTEVGLNAQLFIKLSVLSRDSNQIRIYIDCNRIKSSFE